MPEKIIFKNDTNDKNQLEKDNKNIIRRNTVNIGNIQKNINYNKIIRKNSLNIVDSVKKSPEIAHHYYSEISKKLYSNNKKNLMNTSNKI